MIFLRRYQEFFSDTTPVNITVGGRQIEPGKKPTTIHWKVAGRPSNLQPGRKPAWTGIWTHSDAIYSRIEIEKQELELKWLTYLFALF